jgi:hypothetical protein
MALRRLLMRMAGFYRVRSKWEGMTTGWSGDAIASNHTAVN